MEKSEARGRHGLPKRILAALLALLLLPVVPWDVRGGKVEQGIVSFNPNSQMMEIKFSLELRQYINIAVRRMDEYGEMGELVGYIAKNYYADGAGEFKPHPYDPCLEDGSHHSGAGAPEWGMGYRKYAGPLPSPLKEPGDAAGGRVTLRSAIPHSAASAEAAVGGEAAGVAHGALGEAAPESPASLEALGEGVDVGDGTAAEASGEGLGEGLPHDASEGEPADGPENGGAAGGAKAPATQAGPHGGGEDAKAPESREDGAALGNGGGASEPDAAAAGPEAGLSAAEPEEQEAGQGASASESARSGGDADGQSGAAAPTETESGAAGGEAETVGEEGHGADGGGEARAEGAKAASGALVSITSVKALSAEDAREAMRKNAAARRGAAARAFPEAQDTVLDTDSGAPGGNVLWWNGRVDMNAGVPGAAPDWMPALSAEGQNWAGLVVVFEPVGFPWKNLAPSCRTEADGSVLHQPGENWEWSGAYPMEQALVWLDYGKFAFVPFDKLKDCMAENLAEYYRGDISLEELKARIDIGDPVDAVSGAYAFADEDLRIHGDWPLIWRRFYNSLDDGATGGMGKGFSHLYDFTLREEYGIIYIKGPYGEILEFLRQRGAGGEDRYLPLQGAELAYRLQSADRANYVLTFKGARYEMEGGRLARVTGAGGHAIAELAYDGGGRLARVSNRAGFLEVTWRDGLIAEVRDGAGRAVAYSYDGGALASVRNPDGDSARYGHDGDGRVSALYDREGSLLLENAYDGKGRVTRQAMRTPGGSAETLITYDDTAITGPSPAAGALGVNTVKEPAGAVRRFYYDWEYRVVKVEDEDGAVENVWGDSYLADSRSNGGQEGASYVRDADGNPVSASWQDGGALEAAYDADGRIVKKTYGDGTTERFRYDGGNMTEYVDRNGHARRWSYEDGLLASSSDAEGNVTLYAHDARGFLTEVRGAAGERLSMSHDGAGRVVSATDALGATRLYEYSAAGKLLKERAVGGGLELSREFRYDRDGNLTYAEDFAGAAETAEYGPMGLATRRVDREGHETRYAYTPYGAVASTTDWNGAATSYGYDSRGRLSRVRDAEGNEEKCSYDAWGRLASATDALGNAELYGYDVMGRLAKITARDGSVTEMSYDVYGNLLSETRRDPEGRDATARYAYDPVGNLLSATSPEGRVKSYSYWKNDLLKTATDPEGRVRSYAYDPSGRLARDEDGEGNATSYGYDLGGNLISVTDPLGGVARLERDVLSRVVAESSPEGRRASYALDANGNVLAATDPEGNVAEYAYDRLGRLVLAKDRRGFSTAFRYFGTYGLAEVSYPDGLSETASYNSLGLVTERAARDGGVTRYGYDPCGRLSRVSDAEGYEEKYAYDPCGRPLTRHRDGVLMASYAYDALGRLASASDPKGTVRLGHDLDGLMTSRTDRNGNTTSFSYDGSGLPVLARDPEGGTRSWRHDGAGRLVGKTDARGLSAAYALDGAGNVLSVEESDGLTTARTEFSYDGDGLLTESRDPEGNRVAYFHDGRGLTVKSVTLGQPAPKTVKWEWLRDPEGNVAEVLDPLENRIKYSYDFAGNVISETDRLGHAERYAYDPAFRLAEVTGRGTGGEPWASAPVTRYSYDKLGRLVEATGAEGTTARFSYDAFNLVRRTDGAGAASAATLYESGPMGDPVSRTSPLGGTARYETDAEGNVTKTEDEDGVASTFRYDGLNRLTYAKHGGMAPLRYEYDPEGAVTKAAGGDGGERLFAYDGWGRLTSAKTPDGETSYSYDRNGRRASLAYPNGARAEYSYDHMGRLTGLEYEGMKEALRYDPRGLLIGREYPNGEAASYAYNAEGLRTEAKETDRTGATRRQTTYAYTDGGLLRREDRTGVGLPYAKEGVIYSHDGEGRLTGARVTRDGAAHSASSYEYDARGNLARETFEAGGVLTESLYSHDAGDRLVGKRVSRGGGSPEATAYTYDGRGNLIKEEGPLGVKSYVYDAAGRLASGSNGKGETSRYGYDALGARVFHEEVRGNANAAYQNGAFRGGSLESSGTLGKILKEGRAAWQRVWETAFGTVAQNDMETVSRRYLPDYASDARRDLLVMEAGSWDRLNLYDGAGLVPLMTELSYAEGTERLAAGAGSAPGTNPASDAAAKVMKRLWLHADKELSQSLLATGDDGGLRFHMEYGPWGDPAHGTRADMNHSGLEGAASFGGYELDETLGLWFAQNRFYDPNARRFTQEDTHWNLGNMINGDKPARTRGGAPIPNAMAISQSANLYAYCGNDPTGFVDPMGLDAILVNKRVDNFTRVLGIDHMSAFFQDEDDDWWFFSYGAKVIYKKVELKFNEGWDEDGKEIAYGSYDEIFKDIDSINKYLWERKWYDNENIKYHSSVYVKGDFTASHKDAGDYLSRYASIVKEFEEKGLELPKISNTDYNLVFSNCTEKAMELFYKGVLPDGTEVRDYYARARSTAISIVPNFNMVGAQKLFHNKATNLADFEAAMEKERDKYEANGNLWGQQSIEIISGVKAGAPASGGLPRGIREGA